MSAAHELLSVYTPTMYIAQTVDEKNDTGVPRLKLLPDQYLETLNGVMEEGDAEIAIQCESKPRRENPIGTRFQVAILEKRRSPSGEIYYTSASYCPIEVYKP